MSLLDIFKKQTCAFCEQAAGVLGRKKLADGTYLCKACEKKCSAFLDVQVLDKHDLDEHITYMERQNKLCTDVFEEAKQEKTGGLQGLRFADDIGMFKVRSDASKKKVYQEAFRYDAIKSYEPYAEEHRKTSDSDKCAYDRIGLKITLYCNNPKVFLAGKAASDQVAEAHPYVKEIIVKTGVRVADNEIASAQHTVEHIIRHFDDLFGVPGRQGFFAPLDAQEKMEIATATSVLKGVGQMAKAAVNKGDVSVGMQLMTEGVMDYVTKNRSKYTRLANAAEQQAWGK